VYELVKTLTELPGMIGQEDLVQDFVRQRWQPHCAHIETTAVGNVIARVGGKGPRLLIEGHADEIGVLVKSISPDGFVWVGPKNYLTGRPGRDYYLFGHPCVIQTRKGPVPGVFAALSGHIVPPEMRDKPELGWSDFWVDIGATSAEEATEWGVCIGDGVVWSTATRKLGHYLVGKAMDDRAALAIMTALAERLDPDQLQYELFLASTVQEEVGTIGAFSLERDMRFDLSIAVDVGLAGDVPGVDVHEIGTRLGGGPVLVHHDIIHYDRKLTQALADVAESAGIPVQHAVFARYASDGKALIMGGVATALVAFATRYTHSSYEMVAERDLELCVDLLHAFVMRQPSTG
jgi:endoglucanase